MKTILAFLVSAIFLIFLLSACGPSAEEQQQQREQARQDSLEQVRKQQLEQQRMDSIAAAQARADSIEAAQARKEEERSRIQFDENGRFAVQVEAWRSSEKAQEQISKWNERGFPNAYVVKHGKEETGDVWFRVRLGRVATTEMAERLGNNLQEEYDEPYWVANVEQEEMAPSDSNSQ